MTPDHTTMTTDFLLLSSSALFFFFFRCCLCRRWPGNWDGTLNRSNLSARFSVHIVCECGNASHKSYTHSSSLTDFYRQIFLNSENETKALHAQHIRQAIIEEISLRIRVRTFVTSSTRAGMCVCVRHPFEISRGCATQTIFITRKLKKCLK